MKNLKRFLYSGLFLLTLACSTSEPAPAPTPAAPVAVAVSFSTPTTTGFTLNFDVAVAGLTTDNLILATKPTSVTAKDETNKTYAVVTSTVEAGRSYTVSLKKDGYTFTPEMLTITVPNLTDVAVVATVSSPTATGFTLGFDKAVAGLAKENITIDNSATIDGVTAVGTDNKMYNVATSALVAGKSYGITLAKTGFSFSPSPLVVKLTDAANVDVTATVSNPTINGFTLTFSKAIEGFLPSNITLDNGATVSSATADTTNKIYTVATSVLTAGTSYNASLAKTGFNITPQSLPIIVPATTVTATIISPITTGFTLNLSIAVAGFVKEDIVLSNGATITSVSGDATNKIFTVVTSTLTAGTNYTATLTKTGYNFTGTLTFTPIAVYFDASKVESLVNGGTTTWTVPTGVTKVYAIVVGGGGGGAYSPGGGGGYIRQGNITVEAGATYTITIGAGGAGGAGTGALGTTGGTSSIKLGTATPLIYANGGKGGRGWDTVDNLGGNGSSSGGTFFGNGGSNCSTGANGGIIAGSPGLANNDASTDDAGGVFTSPIMAICTDPVSKLSYGGGGGGAGNMDGGSGGGNTGGIGNKPGTMTGIANTGGGGGGSPNGAYAAGTGGSGTIIIYPSQP